MSKKLNRLSAAALIAMLAVPANLFIVSNFITEEAAYRLVVINLVVLGVLFVAVFIASIRSGDRKGMIMPAIIVACLLLFGLSVAFSSTAIGISIGAALIAILCLIP